MMSNSSPFEDQVTMNDWMVQVNEAAASRAKAKQLSAPYSDPEMDFIFSGIDKHLELLKRGFSIPYDGMSAQTEKDRAMEIARRGTISPKEDYDFVTFVLREYEDFLQEGSIDPIFSLEADRRKVRMLRVKMQIQTGRRPFRKFRLPFDPSKCFFVFTDPDKKKSKKRDTKPEGKEPEYEQLRLS